MACALNAAGSNPLFEAMEMSQRKSFSYLPHTEEERQEMLARIGVRSFDDLVSEIPASVRLSGLDLEPGLSELELRQAISRLAAKNTPVSAVKSFLGGGSYQRFVPAAVAATVSRSEFATAYTPYQPEVSQGSLQAIYEFQTAICLLTGMEVANASMYDGPTAAAEAVLMAARLTGRHKALVSETVNPEYRMVMETYARSCGLAFSSCPGEEGAVSLAGAGIDDETACLVVQYPNYFGCLEPLEDAARACHEKGALLVVVSEPISLGLIEPPATFGADIVVGDAQPCGNSLTFGGPSAGYMATRQSFVRQLPGRLAGMTVDNRGQRAFTLTLQTREQHIRRAKATSNICTNQALNALTMLVYLTLVGPDGLRQLGEISLARAHYLAGKLSSIKGVRLRFSHPFVNEFVIETPRPACEIIDTLKQAGILPGIDLGRSYPALRNCLLVAVTEMNPPEHLDDYARELSAVVAGAESMFAKSH